MTLTFKHSKWVTPLNVHGLSNVEIKQVLAIGSWWDLVGEFSANDILFRLDDGAAFGELDLWRVIDDKNEHIFDFIVAEVDNGILFFQGTNSMIGIGMSQSYFNTFESSSKLDVSVDWESSLNDSWKNTNMEEREKLVERNFQKAELSAVNQRIDLLKSLPLSIAQVKELHLYLSTQKWTPEKNVNTKEVRAFCMRNNITPELILNWFKKYQARTDSDISSFIYNSLRP
jgi:hypothetical protein